MKRHGRNESTYFKRQTCSVCKCQDKFNFYVSDAIWKEVVAEEYQNRVVCLSCFDELAGQRNVDYSNAIEVLYFAGNQATFKFETASAQSP